MTDREKAIIMAHTGVCMLAGDKFQIFHKYVEDIMGRPIWTGDIGWLEKEIKEKSKADFMALCADESSSDVLDKIRVEIEQLPTNTRTNWNGCCPDIDYPEIEYVDVTKAALLGIIDKYKASPTGAESEGRE